MPEYVSLAELFDAAAEPDERQVDRQHHRRTCRRSAPTRQSISRTWVCLAEWVLAGWARTLRAATLLTIAIVVVGAIGTAVVGIYGIAAVAALLTLLHVLPHARQRIVL